MPSTLLSSKSSQQQIELSSTPLAGPKTRPETGDIKSLVLFIGGLSGAGGAERLLWEEEKFFRGKGVDTTVLTFSFDRKSLMDYQPEKVEIMGFPRSRVQRVLTLRRKLQQLKPDLVIGQSSGDSMYLYMATAFTSIPYVVHVHGTLFWFHDEFMKYALIHRRVFQEIRDSVAGHREFIPLRPQWSLKKRLKSELVAILDYLAVRKARQVIVLTDQLKWEVKKLYGRDSVVARGCLPSEALVYTPRQNIREKLGLNNQKIILSLGRLDPRKRVDVVIKAFAQILPQHPELFLLIGGVGEEEVHLKGLTQELGITEKVRFLGLIPDGELYDYYAACDVFAFPSWTSSGITPYEALAVGKRVVWTTEADEPVLKDSRVVMADPIIEDFALGLGKALQTADGEKTDLSAYTWDRYFDTVYIAAVEAISNHRGK